VPETPVPPAQLTGAVPPGYVLAGRYALVRLIARGGMADVWEAKDTLLERQVAVKILHPHLAADAAFVARFRTEAIAAARLHHRSIVAIFDTCSDSGIEAIVMELARGHTLREEIDRHGALEPVVVVNVGVDVADALQSAHTAGLIHRDVKPANILLCDDQRVMVTDFGIAKVRDNSDRTQTGTMLGSVKYVSPEQVEGNPVDPRSDVYSLGVVLYEALTAKPPFVADSPAATALARLHTTPPHPSQLRPDAPRALADLIMRAMSLNPAHRFATATDLRTALSSVRFDPRATPADATQVSSRPQGPGPGPGTRASTPAAAPGRGSGPPPPPSRPPAANRARWGSLIVAVALIAFALIVAAILITQTNANQKGNSSTTLAPGETPASSDNGQPPLTGGAIALQAAGAFDPKGGDGEKDDQVPRALDNNDSTGWYTEYYQDTEFKSVGKPGVGLIVKTDRPLALGRFEVTSSSSNWTADVYVSDEKGATLADWGKAVAHSESIPPGTTAFPLGGAKGQYILLWITRLADGPPGPGATAPAIYTVKVSEVRAFAA
jgi:serine/threonine protein kinase